MALPTTSADLKARPAAPPTDPSINLPRGVREQSERAEAIQRALTGSAEPSALPPQDTPPAQPPAQPSATSPELSQPPAQPPPAEPALAQPPVQPPDEQISPEEWELRYKAMKGRADTMRDQMGQMAEYINRLQGENATLRQQQPPALTNGHAEQVNLLTDQEMSDYGEDFVDVVRRVSAGVAAPLQAEIQSLRSQLGTVQQETGNAFLTRMHATIGGLVPNWQELNRHPAFVQWVGLPDMFSGVIRQQLMQDAWNNGDAMRVAAFFRAFLAEEAAVNPARGVPPAQPAPPTLMPNGQVSVPLQTRLTLDQLAAPGRAHSGAQMPTDKRVYTAQDISRFYTDCAQGKWASREAERAAIDADIIAAQHEGRIIPDQRTAPLPMGFTGNR